MRPFLLKICIVLLLTMPIALSSGVVYGGSLSGEAEWDYAAFQAEQGGERVIDAHHFWHEYSLMYKTRGDILNGRGGGWSLGVGAQWLGLNGDFNGDFSEERFKPLYEGNLVFAPGGVPLRLVFFHRDNTRSSVHSDRTFAPKTANLIAEGRTPRSGIFDPGIMTTIHNGKTVETGATLLLGIRNGSYLGRYRSLLTNFPRLLMDYRQVVVKDLKSATPRHYRQRELAFVSLNKKDNWFHYRFSDYKDYIAEENNTVTKQYILGTITPSMRRHWIKMTNWIKLSADGTFTQTEKFEKEPLSGAIDERDVNSYALNLLGTARRTLWQGHSSLHFSRRANSNGTDDIEKELSVPVSLQGVIDANTRWRFRFEGEQRDTLLRTGEDRLFTIAQLEAFRKQRYRLTTEMSLERGNNINSEFDNARLEIEFFSNSDFRPRDSYHLSYDSAYFSTTTAARSSDFWENSVTFSMDRRLGSRFRWGLKQRLTYGTGELEGGDAGSIRAVSGEDISQEGEVDRTDRQGNVVRTSTTVYGEHVTSGRHRNRVELIYDYLSEGGSAVKRLSARHRYSYIVSELAVSMSTSYDRTMNGVGGADTDLSLEGRVRYQPSRSLTAKASLEYDRNVGGSENSTSLLAEEELNYSIYKINGIIRKLWQFTQAAEYERLNSINGGRARVETYSLGVGYFPWHVLALSAEVALERLRPSGADRLIYDFGCQFTMSKLQMGLTYSYGTQTQDDTPLEDRKEQRLELNVKRIF